MDQEQYAQSGLLWFCPIYDAYEQRAIALYRYSKCLMLMIEHPSFLPTLRLLNSAERKAFKKKVLKTVEVLVLKSLIFP